MQSYSASKWAVEVSANVYLIYIFIYFDLSMTKVGTKDLIMMICQ